MGLYLLDYGAGNVTSLANSLKHLGHDFRWISSKEDFAHATKLVFPGVGAFKSAIEHLQSRGLLDPLKEYITSGRPYFGICIGLQVLFASSTENPDVQGLGIIPAPIEHFDNTCKSVPHMGWNAIQFVDADEPATEGMDESTHYYFVHSYRAAYDPENNAAAAQWVHSTCQYGEEIFVASVRRGNVFGTQFHPEKSGKTGLRILDTWLRRPLDDPAAIEPPRPLVIRHPRSRDRFTKRIVACMDVRANDEGDLVVTKGDQYNVRERTPASASASASASSSASSSSSSGRPSSPNGKDLQVMTAGAVRNLGKPVALAAKYYAAGADELCLLNITSFRHSPLHDQPMLALVRAAAQTVFVPLTIGGGIKDTLQGTALDVAGAYFRAGADKVSIGSEAVYAVERLLRDGTGPDGSSAIEAIADAYGKQAVVVSIDPKRVYVDPPATYSGPYKDELIYGREGTAWWYQCTVSGGREARELSVVQLAKGVETLGAGEILLNSIDRDGTGSGFDLDLIRLVRNAVRIPVVASSGAGQASHFPQVFQETGCEAALAAGIFHRGEVRVEDVKQAMKSAGIETRQSCIA